jgi:hypothetical protein
MTSRELLFQGFEELHEFAKSVGRHPRTIRRLADAGLIPIARMGRQDFVYVAGARERLLAQVNDPARRRRRHAEQAARVAAE